MSLAVWTLTCAMHTSGARCNVDVSPGRCVGAWAFLFEEMLKLSIAMLAILVPVSLLAADKLRAMLTTTTPTTPLRRVTVVWRSQR